MRRPPSSPSLAELEAVQAYLAAGSTKGAAELLGRSPSTVSNQLYTLRRRLRVHTNAQAVAALGLRL